jgi:sugar-specific transcriptional regulator TrmB
MPNTINEENILIQAGLSEDQAQVYDYLLDKGPQKASSISSWTGVKRGLTYKILEQLEIMGLVEKKGGEGTVATFYPQHPSLLMHTLEGKEKELALAKEMLTYSLGSLSSKYNLITGKPNIQFFEGMEGALTAAYDSLQAKGEILTLIDAEKLEEKYSKFNEEYVKQRIKRDIPKRIISPDTPRVREIIKKDDATITDERVIAGISFSETLTMIYNNKVCFITLTDEKKIATIVEDSHVANMHREIFEFMWRNSTTL